MTAKAAKAPTKKTKTTKPKAAAASKPKVTNTVAKTPAKPTSKKSPLSPKDGLRKMNLALGVVLAAEAVAVVVAGNSRAVQITNQYTAKDVLASEATGHEVLATATRHLTDVRLSWLVALFLLVFAVNFVLLATVWRKHYEAWLERGVNKLRWVGSGIGIGLMAVTVAALSGINDLGYLVLIGGALAILGSLSTIVELLGPGRRLRKYVIITALFTAALPVLVIAGAAVGAVMYGDVATYMYFVYGSMLLFALAYAIACILRLRRRGKFADSFYSEKAFMTLGFAAATVLALQIFAGALQP